MCFYLALLLFLVRQKPLMTTLKTLRLPHRVFLIVLVVFMLGAQVVDRGHETFPFVGWSMYTRPARGDPQYYTYTMVSQSGRESRLEVFRVFRSLSYRLMFPLKRMAHNIDRAPEGRQRQAMIADYETALQAVARMYNRRYPDDPIRTLHVWHYTIPLNEYHGPSSIQRRLFWQLKIQ